MLTPIAWFGVEVAAGALIVLGAALMARGIHGVFVRFPRTNDVMTYVQSLRVGVVGLALASVGAAWVWQAPWLLAVGLGVGLQELRETSSYITTIRRRQRQQASTPSARLS